MNNHFALIGAGGTGTILLEPLVRYLSANIEDPNWLLEVVDGDDFDAGNVTRQLFAHYALGMNKAEAAVLRVKETLPGASTNLGAWPEYVGDHNIERFVSDGTYVLIGVDSYRTRRIIADYALTLDNVTVINGGNEMTDGSCQIWMRRDGQNVTPPITFMHPEIELVGPDRSTMSCQQIAALPGGGQLIIANMMSATWMLSALHLALQGDAPLWTDLTFDLIAGKAAGMNATPLRGWR